MAHEAHYRFRGSEKQKDKFTEACEALKIPQNAVFLSLVEFFLSLDEHAQSELVRKPLAAKITFTKGR